MTQNQFKHEDRRVAVGISITLSSQLITAALAMLTIEGAYLGFVLGAREISPLFLLFTVLSAVAFFGSIFAAGKAITQSRDLGFDGNWDTKATKGKYNWQAFLCIVGFLTFMLSVASSGTPIETQLQKQVMEIGNQLAVSEQQIQGVSTENALLKQSVDDLYTQVATLAAHGSAMPTQTASPTPIPTLTITPTASP